MKVTVLFVVPGYFPMGGASVKSSGCTGVSGGPGENKHAFIGSRVRRALGP